MMNVGGIQEAPVRLSGLRRGFQGSFESFFHINRILLTNSGERSLKSSLRNWCDCVCVCVRSVGRR